MTKLQREIIKKAGVNVLNFSHADLKSIKKDVKRRLASQKRALRKNIEKGWSGTSIIRDSILDLQKTLEAL